jgi:hypothetical protein
MIYSKGLSSPSLLYGYLPFLLENTHIQIITFPDTIRGEKSTMVL